MEKLLLPGSTHAEAGEEAFKNNPSLRPGRRLQSNDKSHGHLHGRLGRTLLEAAWKPVRSSSPVPQVGLCGSLSICMRDFFVSFLFRFCFCCLFSFFLFFVLFFCFFPIYAVAPRAPEGPTSHRRLCWLDCQGDSQ